MNKLDSIFDSIKEAFCDKCSDQCEESGGGIGEDGRYYVLFYNPKSECSYSASFDDDGNLKVV